MRNLIFLILLILTVNISFGQEKPHVLDIPSTNKPWSNLNFNNNTCNFHFVVMPDNTGAHRAGILKKGIDRINLMQPEFVVNIGDVIEGYTQDLKEINSQWSEFHHEINQLKMPFFYVAGNHDYSNPVMASFWQQHFGADYYYFIYKNVLFLCLNTEDGTTSFAKADFSDKQFAFIEKILAENPNVDWTMVFMHQPLWLSPSAKNWLKVEKLLSSRKHSVFTGHTHQYALYTRNNSDYFVLSTMGGVNELRGKRYGEFDHFLWVTMTTDGPIYANVMLDGIEDKSIQTAENLARVESFKANPPVRIEPYFYSGKPSNVTSLNVTFNNTTKEDHQYIVELKSGKGLKPGQTIISKKVAAGAKEEMMLPVQINDKGGWSPIIADVTLKADKYEWKTNIHVQPNEKYFIDVAKNPIITDGNLAEWGTLRFLKHDSIGKASFRFDVRSDDKFLHLALDVTDSDIQAENTYANMNQDAAFIVFDARPVPISSFNQRNAEGVFRGEWLYLLASPTADVFELAFKDKMPVGLTAKGRKTSKGYSVEYEIPLELLKRQQGGDWKNIRLNFSIADKNKGDTGEPRRINWMPDWQDNYPGSGMFFCK